MRTRGIWPHKPIDGGWDWEINSVDGSGCLQIVARHPKTNAWSSWELGRTEVRELAQLLAEVIDASDPDFKWPE